MFVWDSKQVLQIHLRSDFEPRGRRVDNPIAHRCYWGNLIALSFCDGFHVYLTYLWATSGPLSLCTVRPTVNFVNVSLVLPMGHIWAWSVLIAQPYATDLKSNRRLWSGPKCSNTWFMSRAFKQCCIYIGRYGAIYLEEEFEISEKVRKEIFLKDMMWVVQSWKLKVLTHRSPPGNVTYTDMPLQFIVM